MRKRTKSSTRIALVGGHMTPAIAIAETLQRLGYHNLIWIGQKYSQTGDKNTSIEYRRVARLNIKFINLNSGKLWRKWTMHTFIKGFINLILIPIGFINASWIIIRYRPNIIVGFGSYLSIPVLLQIPLIKIYKVKTYLHEQTIKPSLSARIIEKYVNKVFLTWEESIDFFDNQNKIVTGNPIESDYLKKGKERPLFKESLPTLLVLGGNQGANTFNKRLRDGILTTYLKEFNIVHQTGRSSVTRDYEQAVREKDSLPNNLRDRYLIYDFIEPRLLNYLLENSTLMLSRSGANTTQKVLLKGIPTIFIPIPWSSNNEQLENAKLAEGTGIAKTFEFREGLTSQELFDKIYSSYQETLSNISFNKKHTWTEAKKTAKKLVKLDATSNIVKELSLESANELL